MSLRFIPKIAVRLLALVALLSCTLGLAAQDTASIVGTVSDSSGAVIPGVQINLVNTRTGATWQATTNSVGTYLINDLPPGPGYKITFSHGGFESLLVSDIYLNVGVTSTRNGKLRLGQISQEVQISAGNAGNTLDTTDATVGSNFNMDLVDELPIQIRDSPAALFTLQPGVNGTGEVNGARSDQNNVTLDGLDVNDFATGQAFSVVGNAPVDTVQEFHGETVGSQAQGGHAGGGQIEMVTKSGTNTFHGEASEYNRVTLTEANEWFNNNDGVARAPLVRNQFGAQLGGPILKDRLFFFFSYNGRRDNQGASVENSVPIPAFSGINGTQGLNYIGGGANCDGNARLNNSEASCIETLSQANVAAIDPQNMGFNTPLFNFVQKRYPLPNDQTGGDGINTEGFRFNAPVDRVENDYVSKIDYTINNSMKAFLRFSIQRDGYGDSVNYAAPIQFPGDPETHAITNHSYGWVAGHTWTINSRMVNQASYGRNISALNFPTLYNPTGATAWTFSAFTSPYSSPSSQKRTVPVDMLRDDFNWQKGRHNLNFGGTFKHILTSSQLVSDFNSTNIGLGGYLAQLDSTLRPSDIETADQVANGNYDTAFTFALGNFGSTSSNWNYNASENVENPGSPANRHYLYYETEGYAGDTWKITPSLTLDYGVRYQWYTVPYEVNGFEGIQQFSVDQYFYGDRIPQSASGSFDLPLITYSPGGKANHAKGFYQPDYKDFAPRVGFAWNPGFYQHKTVIRGGASLVYDHVVSNALNFLQDQSSYLYQSSSTLNFGAPGGTAAQSLSAPGQRFGAIDTPPPFAPAPAITVPYTPYGQQGLAEYVGNYAIDPSLRTPYSITYNFGVQQEFPGNFMMDINYVGRLGRRLIAEADASQIIDFPDTTSGGTGQLMSTAFANVTKAIRAGQNPAPQEWFETVFAPGFGVANGAASNTDFLVQALGSYFYYGDMGDTIQTLAANGLIPPNVGVPSQFAGNIFITNKGFSSYNGLLFSLHKRPSHGLEFDFNYTFSHSIDNNSTIANSSGETICNLQNMRICRANSDFDIKNQITATFVYKLPFGRGADFASNVPFWLNEVIGGWDVSGIPSWQTGSPFNINSDATLLSLYHNGPAFLTGSAGAVQPHVHKASDGSVNYFAAGSNAASNFTGDIGLTFGARNNLRNPNYAGIDMAVGKAFPIYADRLKLKFRAEAYNATNHPSFSGPSGASIASGGSFGEILGTTSAARVMQFSLRLEF